jgi:hypothetical protein
MYVYIGSTLKSIAEVAAGSTNGGGGQRLFFWLGLLATAGVTVFLTRLASRALQRASPPHVTEKLPEGPTDA